MRLLKILNDVSIGWSNNCLVSGTAEVKTVDAGCVQSTQMPETPAVLCDQ